MDKTEVKESKIHNKGLFATTEIRKGEKIIEYLGERSSKEEGDRRSDAQEEAGIPMVIFELDDDYDLDATVGGSGAEYANHSCEPNAESEVEDGHIWLKAIKKISPGEEITYDYNFDSEADFTPCYCGKKRCRGCINRVED